VDEAAAEDGDQVLALERAIHVGDLDPGNRQHQDCRGDAEEPEEGDSPAGPLCDQVPTRVTDRGDRNQSNCAGRHRPSFTRLQ